MKKEYRFACVLTVLLFSQASYASQQQGGKGAEDARPKAQKKQAGPPYNHLFDIENIEGWVVYVNKKDLAENPEQMAAALDHFRSQLYQVRLNVPAPAVAVMQERTPLWFEYDTLGIAYHHRSWLIANGYKPPDVTTMAGFCRAKTFLKGALHQPWVVFHELAHGYDHRYIRAEESDGNHLVKAAYDNAVAAGKYNPVLCRYSKDTKAYGLNNPGEFFAENSEAFFGANDFYPFVRAELREYDPNTYAALTTLWGIDRDELEWRERLLADTMDRNPPPIGWGKAVTCTVCPAPSEPTEPPTSAYKQRQIRGWTVYIAPTLESQRAFADRILKLLDHKLHLIGRYVPEKAVAKLQKVPIWVEKKNDAVAGVMYHKTKDFIALMGLNRDKYRAVEIGNARNFEKWQDLQPSIILHHLAYAYLETVSPAHRKALAKAYDKAKKSGKYNKVLRFDGEHVRHPALLNVEVFFAEMTESYYGFNDHYPFIQFELSGDDPNLCDLLADIWGGKAK